MATLKRAPVIQAGFDAQNSVNTPCVEARAGASRLGELADDVVGAEGEMMDALAALTQKLGDRAVRRGRFQQFQIDATDVEKCRADLLRGDFLPMFTAQPERLFIERHGLLERADRDAEVVNLLNHFLWI